MLIFGGVCPGLVFDVFPSFWEDFLARLCVDGWDDENQFIDTREVTNLYQLKVIIYLSPHQLSDPNKIPPKKNSVSLFFFACNFRSALHDGSIITALQ